MKIFAADTSSQVASAAICDGDKLICEITLNNKLTHSQTLMPIIKDVFEKSELEPSDIDIFAVADGPGSFTGLRIGVTTVKGLAHAVNKPVVGVNTLEAMCYNLPLCPHIIVPVMDARRGEVYNGFYRFSDGILEEICPPRAVELSKCLDEIKALGEKAVFLGDAVPVYKDEIQRELNDLAVFAPQGANMQRASAVAEAAKSKKTQKYFELVPKYIRKSQAEREYEQRGGEKC
ncbi:MAG: tRNA (adenosine(37)-N6)-threonylcarbamoyltransferase complex dimerization subunit type 1 TsaB [Firmicutes bacterium]|nr:tRNA (adenosine(37)-N6)-threonylcarbamoyltransferase complex dimerization subunit type 1 TsaB [Bacillota bacterium]